jgi:hypothetical protein
MPMSSSAQAGAAAALERLLHRLNVLRFMELSPLDGTNGDDPVDYQFVSSKPDTQVMQFQCSHIVQPYSVQVCVVCGCVEEDDDGACTKCGTVLPSAEMYSDIDGRAPLFGYQVI